MPALELMGRTRGAVLWMKSGVDEYGEVTTDPPVSIKVRWEEGQRDILKPDGTTVTLLGTVVVDRSVTIGSIMWLAPDSTEDALDQWYENGSGGQDSGLMTVQTADVADDLKGRNVRRELGVSRYRDTLPAETA